MPTEISTDQVEVQETIVLTPSNSWQLPPQLLPPPIWDIAATVVLGIIAVWAKETWNHYQPENPRSTSFKKMMHMVIPGVFAGLMGGAIAPVLGQEKYTWLFALVIGFCGTPALDMITQGLLGVLEKGLSAMGIEPPQNSNHKEEVKTIKMK